MKRSVYVLLTGIISLQAALAPLSATNNITINQQPQSDKELAWVDEQIQAILPSRIGVPDGSINALHDPIKLKKVAPVTTTSNHLLAPPKLTSSLLPSPPKVVEEPLRLLAIMNKSVLINGKWYKAGESVRNFTLSQIQNNSVLLSGPKNQQLILFLTKQNNNIKIITK